MSMLVLVSTVSENEDLPVADADREIDGRLEVHLRTVEADGAIDLELGDR